MNGKEITVVENQIVQNDPMGIDALGTAEEMVQRLDDYHEKIQTVHKWILETFEPGIDYGKADDRSPKDTLLKPGAEKVCNYFSTTPKWEMDRDTWEMLGKPAGTICYICRIVCNNTGRVIGEGRGAETVGNRKRDANKAIKIAKKCALVDAALSTFCLSDRFTQDSPEQRNQFRMERSEFIAAVSDARTGCESSMTDNQFITTVSKHFIKGPIHTPGQIRRLRKAVIEDGKYDLATGEKIKDD